MHIFISCSLFFIMIITYMRSKIVKARFQNSSRMSRAKVVHARRARVNDTLAIELKTVAVAFTIR